MPQNKLPGYFDLLKDVEFRRDVGQGLLDAVNRGAVATWAGAPVDMMTGLLNAGGMSGSVALNKLGLLSGSQMYQPIEQPVGGSEWIGQQMQKAGMVSDKRNMIAELLAGVGVPAAMYRAGPTVFNAEQAMIKNAVAPTTLNKQAGVIKIMENTPKKGVPEDIKSNIQRGFNVLPKSEAYDSVGNVYKDMSLDVKRLQSGDYLSKYTAPRMSNTKDFYAVGDDLNELIERSLSRIGNARKSAESAKSKKFDNSLLGMLTKEYGDVFQTANSARSSSSYITHTPSGTKIRISDHDLPIGYEQPDIDLRSHMSKEDMILAIKKYMGGE